MQCRPIRVCCAVLMLAACATVVGRAGGQSSGGPAATPTEASDVKARAKEHFDKGLALLRDGAWEAALAEFLRSRELHPTKGNTQNAAVCLRNLRRFDEALEMSEKLLSEFTDWSAEERKQIETGIASLQSSVGTLEVVASEPGAAIMVDSHERGTTPLAGPIRVSAGSHVVRVYKHGFAPFEKRVAVAGRQHTIVRGRLEPLTRFGRLRVTEQNATG